MKGIVKFFNSGKGFGFIAGEDGKEYFVHRTGIGEGVILNDNDSVEFEVTQGDRGPKAINVSKVKSGGSESSESSEDESDSGSDSE